MADDQAAHSWWSIPCPKCRYSMPTLRVLAPHYFDTGTAICPHCQTIFDLWFEVLSHTGTWLGSSHALSGLGAIETRFAFDISEGQLTQIDFTDFGIPEDAVILGVNYLPMGNCFPIETHNNDSRRRWSSRKFGVLGMPLDQTHNCRSRVTASVYWILETDEVEPWRMLAEALEAAAAAQYLRIITPAHSAFEISLSRLISEILSASASRSAVKHFIHNDLSASAALNVVLPFLCQAKGVRDIPEEIRARLNRLRSLRNAVVHDGLIEAKLDQNEVREVLVASVFGFEYVRWLRARIAAA